MAIQFDRVAAGSAASANSKTLSVTIGNNRKRLLAVAFTAESSGGNDSTPQSVTFNGVALTQQKCVLISANHFANCLYYLVNPPVGAYDLVVTFADTQVGINVAAVSLHGVDQDNPIENDAEATGSGTAASIDVLTVNENSWIIDSIFQNNLAVDSVAGSNQIERSELVEGTRQNVSTKAYDVVGWTTMSWTIASSQVWAMIAMVINAYVDTSKTRRLLSHWKMNDDAADTIVKDTMGNNNGICAVNTDTISVAGKINNSLSSNGVDYQSIYFNNSLFGFTEDLTLCGWIYCEGKTGGSTDDRGTPFGNMDYDGNVLGLGIRRDISDDNLDVLAGATGEGHTDLPIITGITSVNNGKWYWVKLTYKASIQQVSAYVNNVLVQQFIQKIDTPGRFIIYKSDLNAVESQWYGRVDDLRLYNYIISDRESDFIYNDGNGTEAHKQITPVTTYRIELRNKSLHLIKHLTKQAQGLTWEWDRIGGCGRCSMSLPIAASDLEDISADYDIQIYLNNNQLVYRGLAETHKPMISLSDSIKLQFFGYISQLKRIRINKTYTNQEVSVIIKDILDNYILPDTSIIYDAADVDDTGFTVESITFDEMADSAISTLAELGAGIEWGVDRNLKFFFKKETPEVNHYLRYKKEIQVYDLMNDYSQIKNRLVIKGGDDLEITVNNTESQSAYGLRTQIVSNSAITASSVANQYGTSLLSDKARINRRATIKIVNSNKFFEENLPLGQINLIGIVVAQAKQYGDDDAIYGNFKYGGQQALQINKIKYTLANEKLDININAGQAVPDIYKQIKQLQFDLQQIQNA